MAHAEPSGQSTFRPIVAIVSKRGRFWSAHPLSPSRGDGGAASQTRLPRTLPLTSNRLEGPHAHAGRGKAVAQEGDLALVSLPRARAGGKHRKGGGAGKARLLRVLGSQDVASNVIEATMLHRGLRRRFPAHVEQAAADAVKDVAKDAVKDAAKDVAKGSVKDAARGAVKDAAKGAVKDAAKGAAKHVAAHTSSASPARRDLRGLPTFTIDPESARDFDDAISAQQHERGGHRVFVHIADVSAYVREGSPLDAEARARSTSVYVPGAVEPMLPEALSNDACSLVPLQDKLAVTVELHIDAGKVLASSFYRSLINSDARLSYEDVDAIFAGAAHAQEPWGDGLLSAREAAAGLHRARGERTSALQLNAPELQLSIDGQGQVSEVKSAVQTESHRLIEHLMIAANEAVARQLQAHRTPCLFRVHQNPQPQRVELLIAQLASLNVPTPAVGKQLSPSQAKALVSEVSARIERHLKSAEAAGVSAGRLALTSLLLRSLQQAFYSPKNVGHAGLGSSCYCHFTSPIRRYPDIVCHRALLNSIGAEAQAPRASEMTELGEWTSSKEREAMAIERDSDDIARCFALNETLYKQGFETTFAGEVTGLIGAGAFVAFGEINGRQAAEPPQGKAPRLPTYEGMLPVRNLRAPDGQRDWWQLNELGTIISAERSGASLRLGQAVAVQVARVEPLRGRVDLQQAR